MKTITKSKLASWRFDDTKAFSLGKGKSVVRGIIDGTRVYFLESRGAMGDLECSVTFTNIAKLKAAL